MHKKTRLIAAILISIAVLAVALLVFGEPATSKDIGDSDTVTWVQIHPVASPPALQNSAIVYDGKHNYTFLFGGYDASGNTNATWIWNGTNWSQLFPSSSPSARSEHAMAYDSKRERIVLFGGILLNDTWEWDGTNWTQLTPTTKPAGREGHAMIYDSLRERIVLFGGWDGQKALNDTWEWDGINWIQRFPANSPSPRNDHAMAYDSKYDRIVLFGGAVLSDTWEWDGNNWVQRFPLQSPSARSAHEMVYDIDRERCVLFGGWYYGTNFDDTWEWDGATWIQRFPSVSPAERFRYALTFDAHRKRVVLFGGRQYDLALNDVWEYLTPMLSVTKRANVNLVPPGEQLTYTLEVSNTGNIDFTATITDILPLNVTLGEISGGTVIMPLGWIVWPPVTLAPGELWTETFVVTVTADYRGLLTNTVQVATQEGLLGMGMSVVTVEEKKVVTFVYLPLILKRWPPIPYQPTLYAINNTDGDGNYTVSWTEQPARLADTYTLEEATNAAFTTGVRNVCTTAQQSCAVSGRPAGAYYYRVRGYNTWGYGAWSNVQSSVVLPPTPTPTPTSRPERVYILPNHSYYVDSLDTFWIVGEVFNDSSNYLRSVWVTVNVFDSDGRLLDVDSSYTYLNNLPPDQRTCFRMMIDYEPAGWAYYEFEAPVYKTDGRPLPDITFLNDSGTYNPINGQYKIVGQARNDHNSTINSVEVVGTVYNTAGIVTGCNYGIVSSVNLVPGQISSFEMIYPGRDYGDTVAYRLQADGYTP